MIARTAAGPVPGPAGSETGLPGDSAELLS